MNEEHPVREIFLDEYPVTLKNMHNPPKKLYMRGKLPTDRDQKYLCIVGSRRWTNYGREAVNRIVSGLRGYPISIVSGLAFGIDSLAHIAALEAGLHCIVFPGSSLEWEEIYPPPHADLAKNILNKGGAVISQWQAGYPTNKWAFPSRNLLMAGISHATLVVEAGYRSGSLMTAEHAEKFDREVFAVPGSIQADNSYGPHMLIKRGAVLVDSAQDILREFGFDLPKIYGDDQKQQIRKGVVKDLDESSALVVKALIRGPMNIDDISQETGLSLQQLNEKVSLLEIRELVKVEGALVRRNF